MDRSSAFEACLLILNRAGCSVAEFARDNGAPVERTEWLTKEEAAAALKVNPRTIKNMINDGRLKATYFGAVPRINSKYINEPEQEGA